MQVEGVDGPGGRSNMRKPMANNRTMFAGDPLIVYLSMKKYDHQSKIDRAFVESVFESFSTKIDKDEDDKSRNAEPEI